MEKEDEIDRQLAEEIVHQVEWLLRLALMAEGGRAAALQAEVIKEAVTRLAFGRATAKVAGLHAMRTRRERWERNGKH